MIRHDTSAFFYRSGLIFRRYYFSQGGKAILSPKGRPVRWKPAQYRTIQLRQQSKPVPVIYSRERQWWMFEGTFYWDNDNPTSRDLLARIPDRERKAERKLERAHMLLNIDANPQPQRRPITRDMRRAVFERDGGKCVQCGGTFDLQYDHIIPVALGGATSVENLQLLCSQCNLEKSDSL